MNALLTLEPRVAGDVIREPDIDFPRHEGNLHYAAEGAGFCPTEYTTICTYTIVCVEHTRYCP